MEKIQQPIPATASVRASISPSRGYCAHCALFAYQCESVTIVLCCQYRESDIHYAEENEAPASFETALSELEQIVTRLEGGDLPLEEALNEFERGVQLARQGQVKLQQAEQRVQILLSDTEDAALTPFTPDNE